MAAHDVLVIAAVIGGITTILTTWIRCHYRIKMAKIKLSAVGDLALLSAAIGPIDPVHAVRELDTWGEQSAAGVSGTIVDAIRLTRRHNSDAAPVEGPARGSS